MATFKNLVTGNILTTEEPETIKLMQESERYAEVMAEKAPTASKASANKSGK